MIRDEKKRLDDEAKNIHRGTKATMPHFEAVHLRLREKYKWYRNWHSLRFSNLLHIFIVFSVVGSFLYYFYDTYCDIQSASKIPQISAVMVGGSMRGDLKAGVFHRSNIKINQDNSLEIDDRSVKIGFIDFRVYTNDLAEWKNVSWNAMTSDRSSIVYRLKATQGSNNDLENTEWSDYYSLSGTQITQKGIPEVKTRVLEVEIILQGTDSSWPKLKYLNFGYSPFNENELLINMRDGLFSWVKNVLSFINKKEGLYSK